LPDSGVDLSWWTIGDKAAFSETIGLTYRGSQAAAMSAYRLGVLPNPSNGQRRLKSSVIYPNAHAYAILAMAHLELGLRTWRE
jgi:hypothetical protein